MKHSTEHGKLRDSICYIKPGIGLADQGTAYVEQAFRWAHDADRSALLFYNHNGGAGLNRKSEAIFAMVKDFKPRSVPIDGVGLQMHISGLDYDSDAVAANIERLTKLGLQVHITELDVSSWIGSHSHGSRGAALPFDRAYKPKPAYHAIFNELTLGRRQSH